MDERLKEFLSEENIKRTQARIKRALTRLGYERYGEDAAQEFYLRVLEGKSQHQTIDQFAIDYIRQRIGNARTRSFIARKNFEYADSYEQSEYDRTNGFDPRESLNDRLDLLRMVESLRGRDREVAYNYYIEGMTIKEIADLLGVTESRVSQLLSTIEERARKFVSITDCEDFQIALGFLRLIENEKVREEIRRIFYELRYQSLA